MNLNEFFNTLAVNPGKKFKVEFLRGQAKNETLKRVVFLALDPFTNFFIRKIPSYTTDRPVWHSLETALPKLEKLSKREVTGKTDRPVWHSLETALPKLEKLSKREVTGNAAIEYLALLLSEVSPSDAKVIERIISKDLKCGVAESLVNMVWPGLIHDYPCMLASAYDQKLVDKVKFPAFVQLKCDGMRFNAIVQGDSVEFRSRNGKEINIADPMFGLPFIQMAAELGGHYVFDGELLCVQDGKVLDRKTGNGILNKAVKGTQSKKEGELVRAVLWDAIPFDKFTAGADHTSYDDRFNNLMECIRDVRSDRVDVVPTYGVNTIEEARAAFERYLAEGQEGIILKDPRMIWENKRSKHQIKFKGELECDLKVTDWVEGTGKYAGRMGALVLSSRDGRVVTNVGTGFSDADRDSITRANSVGRIVAVKYNARISDKNSDVDSLFLPVFIEFRDDKSKADASKDIK